VYADVGWIVHWFAGGDPTLRPLVGIVVEKSPGGGDGMANLTIATFTGSGFGIQESVLHMSHPLVRRQGNNGGGWRHRHIDLAFMKFLNALGMLAWDGDETYAVHPDFEPTLIGTALAELAGSARVGKATRDAIKASGSTSPPPPAVPPPPPPPK
jgi:hypothetical protein